MVKELNIEQLRRQARDIRKAAKELRRKMQEVTDPEERKQLQTRLIRGIKDGSIEVKVSK